MGIELARAFVRVRGDASQLPGDLDGVAGMVQEALSDARTYAATFLAKVNRMGEDFLTVGRRMRNSNEQTRTSFETLIGSVSETEDLLAKLTTFAVKTPFEMPQLLSVTQNLLTAGERGEELLDTIKMFGDAAQGQVGKFNTLGYVVGVQMKAMGERLSTQSQDFRQLSTQGILSIADMAKYFKKSEAEVSKMTFGVNDVRGALKMLTAEGGRFYQSMEKQSSTIIGLESTLSDAWNIMARGVADVIGPVEKLILKLKIDLVSALQSVVETTNGVASGGVVAAIKLAKIESVLLAGAVAARIFGVSFKTAIIGTGIGAAILALNFAIGALTTWFFKSAAGAVFLEVASAAVVKIWANLKEAGMILAESLGEAFENIFGFTLPQYMMVWADGVKKMLIWVAEQFVWLSEVIKIVATGIGFMFRNAYELMAIAGSDLVISVIDIAQAIESVWNSVTNSMARMITGMMGLITALGQNILTFFTGIGDSIRAAAASALEGANAILDGESDAKIAERMKKAYTDSLAKNNREKMKDPLEEMMKAYNDFEDTEIQDPIGQKLKKNFQDAKEQLQAVIAERERLRRKEEEAEDKKEADNADTKNKPKAETPIIEAGRYGFAQFGIKLQDAILKGKGADQQQKMIGALEKGNAIQANILEEAKKNKPGLGP